MPPVTLVLIRHGLTKGNVEGQLIGHQPEGLNDTGWEQARGLPTRLQAQGISTVDLIITSDLPRATQTARPLFNAYRCAGYPDARLRECGFGRLEGLTHEEIIARHAKEVPEIHRHLKEDDFPYDFRCFGGECRVDVVARHLAALEEMLRKHTVQTVVVVGHGRALRNLLAHQWPEQEPLRKNCDFRIVTW